MDNIYKSNVMDVIIESYTVSILLFTFFDRLFKKNFTTHISKIYYIPKICFYSHFLVLILVESRKLDQIMTFTFTYIFYITFGIR
jgi:hypothetical protein